MSRKKRKQKSARAVRNRRKSEAAAELLRPQVEKSWKPYAESWSKHADHFRPNGHYEWMASFLKPFGQVLEIGTGEGSGAIAIARNGSTVVSIDHNPICHDIAERRLTTAGVPSKRERRGRIVSVGHGYRILYSKPQSVIVNSAVLLIEGDIGNDNDLELTNWLFALPQFDAIACWNIGTFGALNQSFGTPVEYRLKTQNVTYEIAERVLRPGGVLHIIDRAPALSEAAQERNFEGLLDCHREQASVTSLIVDPTSIATRPYDQPSEGTGISMKYEDENGGFKESGCEMAFWSILAKKR